MPRWLTLDGPLECTIRAAGTLAPRWAERLGGLRMYAVTAEPASRRVGDGSPAGLQVGQVGGGGQPEAAHLRLAVLVGPQGDPLLPPVGRGHGPQALEQRGLGDGTGRRGVDGEAADADDEGVRPLAPGDAPLRALHPPGELLQGVVGAGQAGDVVAVV